MLFFFLLFLICGLIVGIIIPDSSGMIISLSCFIGVPFGAVLIHAIVVLSKEKIESSPKKMQKTHDELIEQLIQKIGTTPKAKEIYDSVLSTITSEKIECIVDELNLPQLESLKDTIFHYSYRYFYMDKTGLAILKTIEQTWATETPIVHPNMQRIYSAFDPVREKSFNVIAEYPWLMTL